ncbi:Putative F-box domain, WD40/YVTN repeat-like-containing domain superfamily [Septoria linicola]|uniref:F-box domain, WD40/YVTN repeat-like-containing domain superfamily n=1 Tax=Septoria linicola TaxID=215465 RepID=A0A9Q9ENR8_9PEZI|nr:putative F-box domain, WD40/YVTN repeat-like-containing domain superfamily [Septoria linicola]USW56894.1 Putative F-box domain, WD40/YVTN repeat-like-containing domain superfamily [Septoria linicola]
MLPEPSSHIPTATTQNSTEQIEITSQHGRLRDDHPAVPQSPVGAEATSAEEQSALDAALAASLQDAAARSDSGKRGLNSRNTPSPPARNRILEYEQASTPPVKKREGPIFEVIKKPRNPGDKRSPIQDLPNEVLTHVLARLTPNDLASVSRVSKRFHDLVTGPHAWRTAFSHFFPGPDSINAALLEDDSEVQTIIRSERRAFTRLTALASWRSEYIMRTRLLRSLSRGKPVQAASSHATRHQTVAPTIMYNSQLYTTINHIHATFGPASNKKLPRFAHGADEFGTATSSDPLLAKVDSWGLQDPSMFTQFVDRFPGDSQFGLGPGEIVGVPNSMDVSQPYGMIVGEGSPGGLIYYRSTEEMRGRTLPIPSAMVLHELGIPKIAPSNEAITATWIAKSAAIPTLTNGLIGLMSGSSLGVLTAYSLGASSNGNNREQRFDRGQMTARWVLSPGVPLIAIAVDNEHSLKRMAQNRIWAVVLNALGEVFYITKFPKRPHLERGTNNDTEAIERGAWQTGRSVYWNAIEPSRRVAKVDPYADASVDGSYSPRSSWNGMCLSKVQIAAETQEIERYASRRPKDFQRLCAGWDMRRKLEVDFAGDDGNNAGENIVVFDCGRDDESIASVKRFSRCRFQDRGASQSASTPPLIAASTEASTPPSLFGGASSPVTAPSPGFSFDRLGDSLGNDEFDGAITPRPMTEEWRTTVFTMGGLKHVEILASAIDLSSFAIQTTSEDPLLGFSGPSTSSSPSYTPLSASNVASPTDIPGQRARLFAAGTKLGSVLLWDARAVTSRSTDTVNTIEPVRIIHTDSPEISCLALSSLCLVHGGNDGLVQAWDVLASEMQPVRTLNSRFSSRARRRLVQAQASPQGVGINLFAAGAIALDPDPTVLRGMVSLGTHLLYWAYSSSAADQYKSNKRRMRRSERGSNAAGERFSLAMRSNLKNYIENEKFELHREKEQRSKESQRFAGRFGTELLDGSEEEMIAYAAMLSQEAYEQDHARRASDTSASHSIAASSTDLSAEITPARSPSPHQPTPKTEDELDADIAEAIRQSLATSPSAGYDIPIRHAKPKNRRAPSAQTSPRPSPALTSSSQAAEMNDLDFAIQLSLAEEQSKQAASEGEAFPGSPNAGGKGKGRKY